MLLAAFLVLGLGQGPVEAEVASRGSATALLERAFEATEDLDFAVARSLGTEAVDLLFSRLDSTGSEADDVLLTLASAGRLANRLYWLAALDEARGLLERLVGGYAEADLADHVASLHVRALVARLDHDLAEAVTLAKREVDAREAIAEEGDTDLLTARNNLGAALYTHGELEAAHALQESVLAARESAPHEDPFDVFLARTNLALTIKGLGDLEAARKLQASALAVCERTRPEGHPHLLLARSNLSTTLKSLGDLDAARALQESVLAAWERTLPEDHPHVVGAREDLAHTLSALGDHEAARALRESVVAARERTLPKDHPHLVIARGNLGVTLGKLGDLEAARALAESVVASFERTLPEDHRNLVAARNNLATRLSSLGDLEAARVLQESVLAARERTLPEDHPRLINARGNLAATLGSLGDLEAARVLEESVLAACERTLPEDHLRLLTARGNLAKTLTRLGDLEAARALEESVLATSERSLPEDHPDLARARSNLAATLFYLGDLKGARALQELVLATLERTLPEDHPDLVFARSNLAATLFGLGDLEAARALQESVLATRERTLPVDHPDLVAARGNLAATFNRLGDLEAARALRESVLATRERTLSEDHPDLVLARSNLALTRRSLGDLEAARELQESVLAARERTLPQGHPDLVRARSNLAGTLERLGDLEAARALLPELASGSLSRLAHLVTTSSREAREIARGEAAHRLRLVLSLSESGTPSDGRPWAFDLVETLRHVSQATPVDDGAASSDEELRTWRAEASRLRAEQGDLVARSASATESVAREVSKLAARRDLVERRIRSRLADRGHFTESIRAEELGRALAPRSAAVGFLRYQRTSRDPATKTLRTTPSLLAHVVVPEGHPVRVELGSAIELEELVSAWRAALGKPTIREELGETWRAGIDGSTERGVTIELPDEREVGEALRRRVLDPVLEAVGEANRLHVCLDDLLYLVPLDALPLGEGRVGDRYQVVSEVSFARLIAPRQPSKSQPTLLALGGASFDAEAAGPVVPAAAPTTRALSGYRFAPLVQTRLEVQTLGALFDASLDGEAVLLMNEDATKAALHTRAPRVRYLHLATHGWFAPESVPSQADQRTSDELWQQTGAREAVSGLAPMTLCGLALAGANTGADEAGHVPGILTAEELASIDLSACELAVLSACETNVGPRRAGQGIQSLQSAIYAAGARTGITSLWRVDDALTRRLMELFYANLWVEDVPKAKALWEAKRVLRDEGAPVRGWAGWVLTGNPD